MKLRSAAATDRPKAKALRTATGTDSIADRRLRLEILFEDMCGKVSVDDEADAQMYRTKCP